MASSVSARSGATNMSAAAFGPFAAVRSKSYLGLSFCRDRLDSTQATQPRPDFADTIRTGPSLAHDVLAAARAVWKGVVIGLRRVQPAPEIDREYAFVAQQPLAFCVGGDHPPPSVEKEHRSGE